MHSPPCSGRGFPLCTLVSFSSRSASKNICSCCMILNEEILSVSLSHDESAGMEASSGWGPLSSMDVHVDISPTSCVHMSILYPMQEHDQTACSVTSLLCYGPSDHVLVSDTESTRECMIYLESQMSMDPELNYPQASRLSYWGLVSTYPFVTVVAQYHSYYIFH